MFIRGLIYVATGLFAMAGGLAAASFAGMLYSRGDTVMSAGVSMISVIAALAAYAFVKGGVSLLSNR